MNIWLTAKDRQISESSGLQDFAFEVPKDGFFQFGIWLISDAEISDVVLLVNDREVHSGLTLRELPGYYKCSSANLARGLHKLSVQTEQVVERILLSEDASIVTSGQAQVIWDNRAVDEMFEIRNAVLTDEQRKVLVRNGFLFDHEHDAEQCQVPSGVPLGGIGAGKVELTSTGIFTALTTNNNQDCPIYRLPGCYFAASVQNSNGIVTRLLQTEQVDQLFQPVQSIDADMAFPEVNLAYSDSQLPVDIKLHAFSSHIPQDIELSQLPCAFFRFTLSNPTNETQTVRLLWSWESLINTGGHMRQNNRNQDKLLPLIYHTWNHSFGWSNRSENFQIDGGEFIMFTAKDDQGNPSSFGDHLIWCSGDSFSAPHRDIVVDEAAFTKWFEGGCDGEFVPTGDGEFLAGALIATRELHANASVDVDFVLSWYMPCSIDGSGDDESVSYANAYKSAAEVTRFGWEHRYELLTKTREIREILESSSLPDWFVKQLLDSRFVANTNSTLDKRGWFSINEGPTGMCGCRGTLDQRTCSGSYWTTFFPTLDAIELELFARCQMDSGMPSHELGFGDFDISKKGNAWPDLAAAYVIEVHRHYLKTGDDKFLAYHWPNVRAAMDWAVSLDDTGDGIPTLKAGRCTTYDNQHWDGISSFAASIHEAGLTLAADIADRLGENVDVTRWNELADKAHESRLKYLWVEEGDGGYFRNAYNPATGTADDSCFICSLVGEWAMLSAGLKPRLSEDKIHKALESIRCKNMLEHGMTDQSARLDTSAFMQYPIAYYGGAALMTGHSDLAWEFLKLQEEIITRAPSTHYNQTLTYKTDGSPWGLPYYMTATVSWLFLDAIAGVIPDVSKQTLYLNPQLLCEEQTLLTPVFLATSWFMLEYQVDAERIHLSVKPLRQFAPFLVNKLVLALPTGLMVSEVLLNGIDVDFVLSANSLVIFVAFDPGTDSLETCIIGKYLIGD